MRRRDAEAEVGALSLELDDLLSRASVASLDAPIVEGRRAVLDLEGGDLDAEVAYRSPHASVGCFHPHDRSPRVPVDRFDAAVRDGSAQVSAVVGAVRGPRASVVEADLSVVAIGPSVASPDLEDLSLERAYRFDRFAGNPSESKSFQEKNKSTSGLEDGLAHGPVSRSLESFHALTRCQANDVDAMRLRAIPLV